MKITKTTIRYDHDDWLSGLDTSSTDYKKMGGNNNMGGISVLRQFGSVCPSPLSTDVTNVAQITAYLRKAVNVGDYAYLIGSNALVHKLSTLAGGTISVTAPFPHTIDHSHTGEAGNDIAVYYTGTTQRVFYSFNDDTDWDVGIYNVVADTFDDDFMSTVPASPLAATYITEGKGYPHPMIVGDDDILYIGDRNFIHAYDGQTGANGTFYPAVLTLPVGTIITSFVTTQDLNLAIGTYVANSAGTSTFNRGNAKVWFWNYLDLDPNYSRDLRDNYISELIQWGGTIAAFTSGPKTISDAGINKLQIFQNDNFEIVRSWNLGGLPIRGGVDNINNDLYWNSGGRVYAYTKRPDNGKYILNIISDAYSATSGMLRFFTQGSTIHYSFGAGASNGGLMYLAGNYTEGTLLCQKCMPDFGTREMGRLKSVTIKFQATFTGGRSFQLITYLDNDSKFTTAEITTLTSTRYTVNTTNSDGTPLGDFTSLVPQLSWGIGAANTSAPIVEWIEYEYEIVNVK